LDAEKAMPANHEHPAGMPRSFDSVSAVTKSVSARRSITGVRERGKADFVGEPDSFD